MSEFERSEQLYFCVQKFSELGTGRQKYQVVVGDDPDARKANFYFTGRIWCNWPSLNELSIRTLDRGLMTINISARTYRGKPAYVFLWNELVEDRWNHQQERTKLWNGFKRCIDSGDFPLAAVIADLVRIQAGRPAPFSSLKYPQFIRLDIEKVKTFLLTLAASQLRELNDAIAEIPGGLNRAA